VLLPALFERFSFFRFTSFIISFWTAPPFPQPPLPPRHHTLSRHIWRPVSLARSLERATSASLTHTFSRSLSSLVMYRGGRSVSTQSAPLCFNPQRAAAEVEVQQLQQSCNRGRREMLAEKHPQRATLFQPSARHSPSGEQTNTTSRSICSIFGDLK
jgi:hypothetical protein